MTKSGDSENSFFPTGYFGSRSAAVRRLTKLSAWLSLATLFYAANVTAQATGFPLSYRVAALLDPQGLLTAEEHAGILSNLKAAAAQWGKHLYGNSALPVNIDIEVAEATASGRDGGEPTSFQFLRVDALGYNVFESCASYKLRTGQQGGFCGISDITITIEPNYLRRANFIEPNPAGPQLPVPAGKMSLVTVLAHELGHGFGMAGWLDHATGALPAGRGISVYDSLVLGAASGAPYFAGAGTTLLNGLPLPVYLFSGTQTQKISVLHGGAALTVLQAPSENIYHYGRFTSATSDTELTFFGLMAGSWAYPNPGRIPVGALDFALMKDLGLPVR